MSVSKLKYLRNPVTELDMNYQDVLPLNLMYEMNKERFSDLT